MNRTEELAQMKAELSKLQARIEELVKGGEWPKVGNTYRSFLSNGLIEDFTWDGGGYATGCQSIGNVFRTHEAAEQHVEYLKVVNELRRTEGRSVLDFVDGNYEDQFGICIMDGDVLVYNASLNRLFCFNCWWASEFHAEVALAKVGAERIRKAYLYEQGIGVEEQS